MTSIKDQIGRNLSVIRQRIADAAARAGRDPGEVRLVAVTKTVGVGEIAALLEWGVTDLGENRIETAREKIEHFGADAATWHMIGACQRRKVRDILQLFTCVDAIDRLELAEACQRRCEELDRTLPVLIEVNVAGETAKHGFTPAETGPALKAMAAYDRLKVQGLMTMAPFVDDPEEVRPVFASLRILAHDLGLAGLSMGMSNDYEVAVEEGATQVRIGTALFAA